MRPGLPHRVTFVPLGVAEVVISSDVSGKDEDESRGLVMERIQALTSRGCSVGSCIADGTFVMIMMPPAVATFAAYAYVHAKLSVFYDVNGNYSPTGCTSLGTSELRPNPDAPAL